MIPKPESCRQCVGWNFPPQGWGFVGPDGSGSNGVLIVAEAPGEQEAKAGRPLVGRAGLMFEQMLQRGRMKRQDFRLCNVLSCRPPDNKLRGMSYEAEAMRMCQPYLNAILTERSWGCIVACGGVALRALLPDHPASLTASRGYVFETRVGGRSTWLIPTFHPSFIQRGQTGLAAVVIHDLQRAVDIARKGFTEADTSHFLLDPPVGDAVEWVRQYEIASQCHPDWWLSVDIETPRKGEDEEALSADAHEGGILRCGYSYGAGRAVLTCPWGGRYEQVHRRLLASWTPKLFWNAPFDVGELRAAGYPIQGAIHDGMVAWHVLNSDLKKSLGFVATFYCPDVKMWKHLAKVSPAWYNAMDSYATDRIMFG